ncbi:MAG TPA: hypothetical protein VEK38_02260 [Candidatus Bathyarchaeia archaeon]|nr:hypothetical protein [Candidatus Bathyarchaeia archaeon]
MYFYYNRKIFLAFLYIFSTSVQAVSVPAWICTKLLGSEPAPEVLPFITEARTIYGIKNSTRPVNYITASSWLSHFSSFTWFGTWVDKKFWTEASSEQKKWTAFHEIAHEKLHHPEKIITAMATTGAALYWLSTYAAQQMAFTALKGFVYGMGIGAFAFLSQFYLRICEQNADCLSTKTLLNTGYIDIVTKHLEILKNAAAKGKNTDICFPALADQIHYLEYILAQWELSQHQRHENNKTQKA